MGARKGIMMVRDEPVAFAVRVTASASAKRVTILWQVSVLEAQAYEGTGGGDGGGMAGGSREGVTHTGSS